MRISLFSFRWSSRSLDSSPMSFFLLSVSFSMSASSTLALNFISFTLAIKLSMAFVTASALSVALFKLSFASCKEVVAVSSSDFAEVKLLPASFRLEAVGQTYLKPYPFRYSCQSCSRKNRNPYLRFYFYLLA